MARTEILPDGRAVIVPDDMTREEALAITGFSAAPTAPAARADKQKSDFIDDVQRGAGGLMTGIGSALRDVYEPAGVWLEETGDQIVKNNPADYGSLSDIKGLGDLVGFGIERIAEMAPQLGGAAAASLAGSPLAGLAVMGGTTGVTQYGESRAAQREAGEENKLRAALAAVPAAALDVFGVGRVVPGAGKVLGEVFEGGLRGAAKAAGRVGVEEAGTEVAQQALQRYGGMQELTSPEAIEEYKFSALAGALGGGPLGGVRGYFGGAEPAPTGELPPEPEAAPAMPTGPLVPPEAPPGIAEAPALSTLEIPRPNAAGAIENVPLSILSQPDDGGNVWVRGPEGQVSAMPAQLLRRMGASFEPQPAPEAPRTFTTTTEINGTPIAVTGEVPPSQPAPEAAPVDVLPPEPAPAAEAAPEPAAPPVPAPLPLPEAGAPEEAAAPTAPLSPPPTQPAAAEVGVAPPVEEPAPQPEVPQAEKPESYTFTKESAEVLASHDPDLAKSLVGKTASSAFDLLAQRTQSPFYRQLALRGAGMAKAMERAGIRMPVGVTRVQGGLEQVTPLTAQEARKPNVGGVTVPFPQVPNGPYNTFEVAMKGSPTKTVRKGANETTLLHELLHSVTTGAQRMADRFSPDSRVGQALKDAQALHKTVKAGVADIQSGKLQVSSEVQASLNRLLNTNAFRNERELIAWGMTDYDMQQVLKAIPVKQGNAFTEFVRVIAKMLGVGPKDFNALRQLIEITDVIIPAEPAAQQEVIDVVTDQGKALAQLPSAPAIGDTAETVVDEATAGWSEKRIKDYLREYGYSMDGAKTKGVAVSMTPDQFLNLTTDGPQHKAEIIKEAGSLDLRRLRGDPTSIFLSVEETENGLQVVGHEGRHRMAALQAAGITDAPVVLRFYKGKDRVPQDVVQLYPEDFGSGRNSRKMEIAFNAIPISYDYADRLSGLMTQYGNKVDLDYQSSGPPATPAAAINPQGRAYIQIPLDDEKRMDRYRRLWADRMRRLGFVEEAIESATGHPLARTERTTEKAALFEGRAQERLDALQRDHLNKIIDVMRRLDITPNEADLFLLARAAFDRNAKIAQRNPNMPDGGSGLTNAEAQAILTEFLTSGRMPKMEALAREVDALTAKTRQTMVDYGMLRPEQADALVESEPYYVPLKGLAEAGDLSVSGDNVHRPPNSGRGFGISRKEFLATKGRSSLPFSPLANAMADAQAAIIRGERNRVGQSFLNDIAKKYDSNAWEVYTDENPEKQEIYNSKTKKVERRPVQMELFPDRYFIVKENGTPYYIKINDSLLMRALTNGSSKDFAAVNKFLGRTIGLATQALSRLHTTLNPEFFVPNFARDIEAAVFNILAEQDAVDGRLAGKKIVTDVLKDIKSIKNFRMLFKATFNHEATTNEQRQTNALFQQAKEDGAFTGWILRETPEEQMEKIKEELAKANATGKEKVWYDTKDKAVDLFQKVQDFNSVFENVTRFAVYKNALNAGLTRDEAANMARNVTVDFNKKGEAGPTANALYAFFNAAVRGNAQLLRSLTAKSADGKYTRAQKMAMGLVAFGVLQTMIARGMSDEDEDGALFYDKIPSWEKQRNLIMMMPNGREYIKIPLPYGYSFFHTMGTLFAEASAGVKTAGDVGVGLVSGLLNNFSPLPIGGESLSGIAASTVPTVLRPFADLMINQNFFGSPIYNEPFDENQAMSSVSRYSTWDGYKAVVEFLNEATGGRGRVAGAVDIPAESLEYLVQQYVGGAGKFGASLIEWGGKIASGSNVEMRNVPVLRKVLGEPNQQNDLGLYFDRINEIQPVERQYRNSNGTERADLREKFPVETSQRVIAAMKDAQRQLKLVNAQKKNLLDRDMDYAEQQERLERLNERQHDIYLRFNRIYNQQKERED